MASLWTPELRRDFHEAVEALHAITSNPSEEKERDYRDSLPDISSTHYALRLKDELQLADHVAFLAHSTEGVHAISAACVEESDMGLVIRLASNRTPSEQTVSGLKKILTTFSNGARDGIPSAILEELLFEDVLDLSTNRILQRIRPSWIKLPGYYQGGEKPLWVRINSTLSNITLSGGSTPYNDILSRFESFHLNARFLEHKLKGSQLRDAIKNFVRSCVELSYNGEHKSLEQQVTQHGGADFVNKEVLQIDKLARYLGLCRDLGKLSQRCNFRNTSKEITLDYVDSLPGEQPKGASQTCYVHAEVQLILYYERFPKEKPPRAIGCSKSACFLCDMLIQKLRKYWISRSHKRLYNQWTIKDVDWMTAEQLLHFRGILKAIVADIASLRNEFGGKQLKFKRFGLESRAVLPLSSNSSLGGPSGMSKPTRPGGIAPLNPASTSTKSESTIVRETIDSKPHKEADSATNFALMHPAATLSCPKLPAMLDISKHDLPHRQKLGSKAETCLELDKMLLIFNCSLSSAGSLSIRKVEPDGISDEKGEVRRIRAADIPTTEMRLRSGGSPKVTFRLQTGLSEVEVEIIWH